MTRFDTLQRCVDKHLETGKQPKEVALLTKAQRKYYGQLFRCCLGIVRGLSKREKIREKVNKPKRLK